MMEKGWAEISRISSEIVGMTGLGILIPYLIFGESEAGVLWMVGGAFLGLTGAFIVIFRRMKTKD